jgi:hypothetical protein
MYLIPAPEVGVLEYRVVTVAGLDYKECSKRAHHCAAWKFIPDSLMSNQKIKEARTQGDCSGHCSGPSHHCSIVCMCDLNEQCVNA